MPAMATAITGPRLPRLDGTAADSSHPAAVGTARGPMPIATTLLSAISSLGKMHLLVVPIKHDVHGS